MRPADEVPCEGECGSRALRRFVEVQYPDSRVTPGSAIWGAGLRGTARVDSEALDGIDWRLPGAGVYDALEEAAEIVASGDEPVASTE